MSSKNYFSPEMKALMKNEKALGWLGIGLLIMWACALMPIVDMVDGHSLLRQFLGYIGMLVVTITGIGLALYMSSLESAAKALDKRLHDADEAVKYWQQQSGLATPTRDSST